MKNVVTYSLDEANRYVVLDTLSVRLTPTHGLLNQRETFFQVPGSDEKLYISNEGRWLTFVGDDYILDSPNKTNDGFATVTLNDGSVRKFDMTEQIKLYHRVDDDDQIYPIDRNAYHIDVRNNVPLNYEEQLTHLKLTCHGEWEERKKYMNQLKGTQKKPNDINSLTFFNPRMASAQRIGLIKYRRNNKNGYEGVKICDEWSDDNPDRSDNFFYWTINNYYYHPLPLELDKDISSIWSSDVRYSPETCMYVPQDINDFFRQSSVIAEIKSGNFTANHYNEWKDKIQSFVEREKSLEPEILHQAHRKLIKQLESILNKMTSEMEKKNE